ncbi:hypothetical protein AMECASPLE_034666 [Ameca splendens]|uniref:Uncharacterized protein n=1 Tax=Ameca splendens TaxID=208324 RepID=A0ABV0Y725_9TELE
MSSYPSERRECLEPPITCWQMRRGAATSQLVWRKRLSYFLPITYLINLFIQKVCKLRSSVWGNAATEPDREIFVA